MKQQLLACFILANIFNCLFHFFIRIPQPFPALRNLFMIISKQYRLTRHPSLKRSHAYASGIQISYYYLMPQSEISFSKHYLLLNIIQHLALQIQSVQSTTS